MHILTRGSTTIEIRDTVCEIRAPADFATMSEHMYTKTNDQKLMWSAVRSHAHPPTISVYDIDDSVAPRDLTVALPRQSLYGRRLSLLSALII
jgi:hypothetical protein